MYGSPTQGSLTLVIVGAIFCKVSIIGTSVLNVITLIDNTFACSILFSLVLFKSFKIIYNNDLAVTKTETNTVHAVGDIIPASSNVDFTCNPYCMHIILFCNF